MDMTFEEFKKYIVVENLSVDLIYGTIKALQHSPEKSKKYKGLIAEDIINKMDYLFINIIRNKVARNYSFGFDITDYEQRQVGCKNTIKHPICDVYWLPKIDLYRYLSWISQYQMDDERPIGYNVSEAADNNAFRLWNVHKDDKHYQLLWVYLICCNIVDFIDDSIFYNDKEKVLPIVNLIINCLNEYNSSNGIGAYKKRKGNLSVPKGYIFQLNNMLFVESEDITLLKLIYYIYLEIIYIKSNYQMTIMYFEHNDFRDETEI